MNPHALRPNESLENYEIRLKLQHDIRQRNIVIATPEHEYRRRVAEASLPIRRPVPIPDARTLNDADYEAAKAKLGFHTQSLMR